MTVLTPPEHSHSAAVDEAAAWLAETPPQARQRPVIPLLKERFGLTTIEAIEAAKMASDLKERSPAG